MRVLTEPDFLALWERGQKLHPFDRGLLTVDTAFAQADQSGSAEWPLGRLNRALAQIRCACFGPAMSGWTTCRNCAEQLEFAVDGRALADSPPPAEDEPISVDGQMFRLPTSRDLAGVVREADPSVAARRLAERCRFECGGNHTPVSDWTEAYLDAVGERMTQADSLAEILLHFDCPACGDSFDESLDLSAFLWAEVEHEAKRMLHDVHTLASAYGWTEGEILALSPARRVFFIELVRA
jgi:hypothetical protein